MESDLIPTEGAAVTPRSFGIEGITDEDRAYGGSRFSSYAKRCSPILTKDRGGLAGGRPAGPSGHPEQPAVRHPAVWSALLFRQATERAVDSAADLRWGPDRKGFRRLVHPNGICLTGLWQITEDTGYSGYFALQRQHGLGHGPLFHVLRRDPARPYPLAVAGRQALSDQ